MAHESTYTLIEEMPALLGTIQPQSITSRTFFKDDNLKAILFGFDAEQELSEHTSSQAAILQIVQGEASVTVGDDHFQLKEGGWLHIPPRLKHSVFAKTPLILLLTLYNANQASER